MSPAIQNLLETFNADIAEACRDGVDMAELTGLAGSISESLLRGIVPEHRLMCWNTITKIMNRKFEQGKL